MSKTLMEQVFEAAGGRTALRQSLGLSKQTMRDWNVAGFVPSKHAAAVSRITGLPKAKLCPSFDWGSEPTPEPSKEAANAAAGEGA